MLFRSNWVFKLKAAEYLSGKVQVRSSIAYFTTVEDVQAECAEAQGRLYGVHSFKPNVNEDGEAEPLDLGDGRVGSVQPSLPLVGENGESLGRALALLLPPGRVAFGLVVVSTPSCVAGQSPATEVVLNLADESKGARGRVSSAGLRVERVTAAGGLRVAALNKKMFTQAGLTDLSVCLDCDRSGNAAGGGSSRVAPFRAVVRSWGSTFTN